MSHDRRRLTTASALLVCLGALVTACTPAAPGRSPTASTPAADAPAASATVAVDLGPVRLSGRPATGSAPVELTAADPVAVDAGLAAALAVALAPEELRRIDLRLPVAGHRGSLAGAVISVLADGVAAEPLLRLPAADALRHGIDLAPAGERLAALVRAGADGLRLRLDGAAPGDALLLARQGGRAATAVVDAHPGHDLLPAAGPRPRPGTWAVARDGHFWYGGERLRMWGPCVNWAGVGAGTPDRLVRMGANAVRLWGPPKDWHTPDSARTGAVPPPGDSMDRFDRFIARCRERGLFVMTPMLAYEPAGQIAPFDVNGHLEMGPIGKAFLADDSWIAGGDDWQEWKAAVMAKGSPIRFARYFDDRLDRLRRRHAEIVLDHVNPYTGRRYAEEETIAVWEIDNENGFVHWALHKGFADWPPYFRAKLQRRWNGWLAQRHPDRAALAAAWGALGEAEDPARGSVDLAPILSESPRYPQARAADLMRFLTELVIDWNRGFTAFCRSRAPAGTGIAVQPVSADTLFQNDPAWLYANTASGEVNCFGIYSYTLTSALDVPPSFYVLDHNTVAGRPTVLYEVNAGRPNPYRAEFPFRLAALAAWQDWDGVFWHMWKSPLEAEVPDEHYLARPMAYPGRGDYTTCVNHQYDPAMCSATALAGDLFLRGLLAPAPAPVTWTVGGGALFSTGFQRGLPLGRSAFTDGARIAFAPASAATVAADRQPARPAANGAVASGDQILWDWPNGRLIIDAPALKVYVGPDPGTWRFRDGVAIGGFGATWAAVAISSADGRPLAGADPCRRLLVNAVADAWNTGFRREPGGEIPGAGFIHPLEQMGRIAATGRAPVVQQPVACTVWLPRRLDGALATYDFATRLRSRTAIADGNRIRLDGPAVYLAEIAVEAWGGTAETPASTPVAVRTAASSAGAAPARRTGAWLPVPGLDWAMDAAEANQAMRDSTLRLDAVGRIAPLPEGSSFLVSGLAFLDGTADVQFAFAGGRLRRCTATFSVHPGLAAVAERLRRELGAPAREDLRSTAFETSTVEWRTPTPAGVLAATLGETQGVLSLRLACEPAPRP